MLRTLASITLLSLTAPPLAAQGASAASTDSVTLSIGTTLRLASTALGETRVVDVLLPRSYGRGMERYPILIVLDGESQGVLAASVARFLAEQSVIPELIVVGVRNGDRNLNFTPTAIPGYRPPQAEGTYGGADRFLAFLETELLPTVEARYRTEPYRILAGHSIGGLFVLHALGNRLSVFQGYLALDPSTWWNNRSVIEEVRTALSRRADPRIRLVVAEAVSGVGGDWPALADAAGPGFVGNFIQVTGETHGTMPLRGLPDGLRALFADYAPRPSRPGVAPLVQARDHFEALSRSLGYRVHPPASVLAAATEASIAAGRLADADTAVTMLEERSAPPATVNRLRADIAAARSMPDDPDFVPLVFSLPRPSPIDGQRLLGSWRGTVRVPDGTDYGLTVTLEASGDTILATAERNFNGEPRRDPLQLVRLTDNGIEWGVPLRGLAGMQVYVATLTRDGATLEGVEEIRGARLPPQLRAAVRARQPSTFRLERVAP